MSPAGLFRRIDRLGRIVLPVEMRRALEIADGDELAISREGDQIVLRKVPRACTFCDSSEDLRPHRSKLVCRSCATELARQRDDPASS